MATSFSGGGSQREPPTKASNWSTLLFAAAPFLAHLAKGNVSFCHHLASVVCNMDKYTGVTAETTQKVLT
jgi:hypothetical protein